MSEPFPWRNLDDHRWTADAALAYAKSAYQEGAGFTVRLHLASTTIEGVVAHESRVWLILEDERKTTFVAKSMIEAVEIIW